MIPYWDWSRPDVAGGRYPAAFARPGLADSSRFADGDVLAPDTFEIVKRPQGWNTFGGYPKGSPNNNYGEFELRPHNHMHGNYIGGRMGNPESAAEDPIYWSFHCFIDLLWSEWQRRSPAQAITSPSSVLRGFVGLALNKAGAFERTTDLGYDYLYTAELREIFAGAAPPPLGEHLVDSFSLHSLFSGTLKDRIRRAGAAEFDATTNRGQSRRRLVIVLRELGIPKVASFTLRGFVHPRSEPFEQQTDASRKAHYVGYVTLWKAHAHAGHGHGGAQGGHGHPLPT
jgi:hypothetical protein